mmetsp:Transcript_32735/g.56985  ORF Transcript_32735/g.56985 Transcript_32735/m.56985 type:complete len:328 (-) Transcript_32735:2873-3856(-)
MVVVGVSGTLCSGKESVAQYLSLCHGFRIINLESQEWEERFVRDHYDSEEAYRVAVCSAALDTIAEEWRDRYVVYPITLPEELEVFRKRSYFFFIALDAPVSKRYPFYVKKHGKPKDQLQGFLKLDDRTKFGLDSCPCRINECLLGADRVVQNTGTLEELYLQIRMLDILNKEHMRPTWDTYFIRLAELASTRSNCMQYHSGCVVVSNHSIVSTGYNGTPVNTVNCCQGGCDACNRYLDSPDECMCLHSETSALLEAGRALTDGSTMYSTSFPCVQCAKNLVQSGIVRLVYSRPNTLQPLAATLLENAGLQVELHPATIQFEEHSEH